MMVSNLLREGNRFNIPKFNKKMFSATPAKHGPKGNEIIVCVIL